MVKPRKPLRRTAWSMLIGGVVVAGLMFGGSALAVRNGSETGPAQSANWPAGADIGVFRPLGPQSEQDSVGPKCTVTRADGAAKPVWPSWSERLTPDFEGPATITCERPARVLTGWALTVAGITQSAWIALPLFVAFLGILLFFPRFTMVWASLSQPIGRWIRRRSGNEG